MLGCQKTDFRDINFMLNMHVSCRSRSLVLWMHNCGFEIFFSFIICGKKSAINIDFNLICEHVLQRVLNEWCSMMFYNIWLQFQFSRSLFKSNYVQICFNFFNQNVCGVFNIVVNLKANKLIYSPFTCWLICFCNRYTHSAVFDFNR